MWEEHVYLRKFGKKNERESSEIDSEEPWIVVSIMRGSKKPK